MSALKFDTLQKDIASRLAANTALAGVLVLLEFDPDATPDQLAAVEGRFEAAMTTGGKGLAIIVLSPFARSIDFAKGAGVSLLLTVPLAICENPEIARARPGGARLNALVVVQECIRAVVGAIGADPGYKFPADPFGRPEIGKDGLVYYYLFPERRHGELAA